MKSGYLYYGVYKFLQQKQNASELYLLCIILYLLEQDEKMYLILLDLVE